MNSQSSTDTILNALPRGFIRIQSENPSELFLIGKSHEMCSVENSQALSSSEVFGIDDEKNSLFESWVKIAVRLYPSQPWSKIEELAPVKEIKKGGNQNKILLAYYPVENSTKKLSEIIIELTLQPEKTKNESSNVSTKNHQRENEVRAILSIANTPVDELLEFIQDSAERMKTLFSIANELEGIYLIQRENHGKEIPGDINDQIETIYTDTLFRHLHTIKGNALTYDFEEITQLAHEAESLANQLKPPIAVRREDVVKSVLQNLNAMATAFDFIKLIYEKIYGREEERTIRIPQERVETIYALCQNLDMSTLSTDISRLVNECNTLSWKSLATLSRKLSRAVYTRAIRIGKDIEFTVENGFMLVEPSLFQRLDDCLLQIVSNAVVHGIEEANVRMASGKGRGQIKINYSTSDTHATVCIADDGRGIQIDLLVSQFIEKGLISPSDVETMTEEEKVKLIFLPRSSTASTVTTFSGRGIGMDVVRNRVESLGGTITVSTHAGKGTIFTIVVPKMSRETVSGK